MQNKGESGILPIRNSLIREREPAIGVPYNKFIVGTDQGIALWNGQSQEWGLVTGRHVEIDNNQNIYTNINGTVKKYNYTGNLLQTSAVIDSGTISIQAIALIQGYVCGTILKTGSTTSWTGVFVLNPDGSVRWLNYDGNSATTSSGVLHQPDIKVDRQGYCYVAAFKNNILYLQKWSIITGNKIEAPIGNPNDYNNARLAIDFSNDYAYIITNIQGSTPIVNTVIKIDLKSLTVVTKSNTFGNGDIGTGAILNCDLTGNVFAGMVNGDLFKFDPNLTTVDNFDNLGYSIERVIPDVIGNIFVSFDTSSGGNLTHVYKYNSNLNRLFNINQVGRANGVCVYPGNVSQVSSPKPPAIPTNVFFQREGKYEGTLHWSYNDIVAGAFNIFVNDTEEGNQIPDHYLKINGLKDGVANLINVQTDTLFNNRSDFAKKYIYGGLIDLEPETITYYDNVIAAGGQTNDLGWIDSYFKLLKQLGLFNNLVFLIDGNMGVKIDASDNILNIYDASPSAATVNGVSGSYPVLQRDNTINNKYSMYFHPGRLAFPAIEMMSSELFFVGKLNTGVTANYQVITNSDNTAQIRETESGGTLNINGTEPLGSPSVAGAIRSWHIGQAILKKAATAQVGINGNFGNATNHTINSWLLNDIGTRSSSEPYNGWLNHFAIINTILTATQRNAIYNLIKNYYGVV